MAPKKTITIAYIKLECTTMNKTISSVAISLIFGITTVHGDPGVSEPITGRGFAGANVAIPIDVSNNMRAIIGIPVVSPKNSLTPSIPNIYTGIKYDSGGANFNAGWSTPTPSRDYGTFRMGAGYNF